MTTTVIAAIAAALTAWSHPTSLMVNGQRLVSDVPPVTHAHQAFVPLRVVGESLGAQTTYDPKSGVIEVLRGEDTLRLRIGERVAVINGRRMSLKEAPLEVRGRTMVPLEVLAGAFGSKVRYDAVRGNIDVLSPGMIEAGAP